MTITDFSTSGSKVTYHSSRRDSNNANDGTIIVTHAADPNNLRVCKLIDYITKKEITSAEWEVVHTSDTTTTFTNKCGASSITSPATISVQTGNADTFTTSGTYTGKVDGNVSVACVKNGELGVTDIKTPAVLVGGGSADTLTTAGTYTGSVSGDAVGTVTLTGETGTATLDWVFPDGTLVPGWVSGASGVSKVITQGVELAMTTQAGDDLVIGDTLTIGLLGIASLQATFPDGTIGDVVVTSASTVATVLGQGVSLAMTSQAGTDLEVGDIFLIAVQAGTKDLKATVSVSP